MSGTKRKWYLYHLEEGRIVMDNADHTDHHKQAREAMGLPKPRYVAGTLRPLTKEEIERYEAFHSVSFEHAKRKDLPEFVEPAHWARIRARKEAHRLKMEAKE